jgi:hypothetical protein
MLSAAQRGLAAIGEAHAVGMTRIRGRIHNHAHSAARPCERASHIT